MKKKVAVKEINGVIYYGKYPYTEIDFTGFKYRDLDIIGMTKDGAYLVSELFDHGNYCYLISL